MEIKNINLKAIERYLDELSEPWSDCEYFHFRFIRDGHTPSTCNFSRDNKAEMLKHICGMNETHNVYSVVNPVPKGSPRVPKDEHIQSAYFAFIDADDGEQTKRARGFKAFAPHMEVITGETPSLRIHRYYKFTEPMTDMAEWTKLQKMLSSTMQTDPSIHNPSRIMRVAGTINYPSKRKLKNGYVAEVSHLNIGGCYVD